MLFCQQNDRCIRKRRQIYKETGSINGMMYSTIYPIYSLIINFFPLSLFSAFQAWLIIRREACAWIRNGWWHVDSEVGNVERDFLLKIRL